MELLRKLFAKMGFTAISTYIQSGNVIFQTAPTDKKLLAYQIAHCLADTIDYHGKIFIRSHRQMLRTVKALPSHADDPQWRSNVLFLSDKLDARSTAQQFSLKEKIEQISWSNGVLFWSVHKASLTKSTMMKLPVNPLYQEMTIRNARTTRKIAERMG